MKISVTAEDIVNGQRCESSACPIALAIVKVLKDNCRPTVSRGRIAIWLKQTGCEPFLVQECSVPDDVRAFVFYFDGGAKVQPFEFDLAINPDYLKEANHG